MRMLAIYAFLSAKLLFKGKLNDAWCFFIAFFIRLGETLANAVLPKRVRCVICGWQGHHFLTYVPSAPFIVRRKSCPQCQSLERHRGMAGVIENLLAQRTGGKVDILEVAPNPSISNWLRRLPNVNYLSIDLQSQFAMKHMDVQDLKLDDGSYDIIVCYHVLDYVPDDKKAVREFYRVLREGGVFMSQEGMDHSIQTYEWGTPLQEKEYRIRQYGSDYPDMVQAAGFQKELIRDANGGPVYLFTKPMTEHERHRQATNTVRDKR